MFDLLVKIHFVSGSEKMFWNKTTRLPNKFETYNRVSVSLYELQNSQTFVAKFRSFRGLFKSSKSQNNIDLLKWTIGIVNMKLIYLFGVLIISNFFGQYLDTNDNFCRAHNITTVFVCL